MRPRKVALITGAAGGLGKAIAHRLFREGFHLALSDIDEDGLKNLQQELIHEGNKAVQVKVFPGDLSDLKYGQSLVDACEHHWNRLAVLVNNAVWRTHDNMRTISEETWHKIVQIGLTAPAFLIKWATALMEAYHIAGTVVNISSIQAERTGGTSPAYVACKGAMNSLTYDLAALYGKIGIRVVGVAPGNVVTPLSNDFMDATGENISQLLKEYMEDQTPLQRSADPIEIANVVFWLTTSEASFVNGTIITVDGGFSHGFGSNKLKNKLNPNQF